MEGLLLFWRHICFLIRKEFLTTIKDPMTQTILIFPVIVQSIIFGYAANYNLETVPYACADLSRSRYSTDLLARLDGSGIFQREATLTSTSQVAAVIDNDEAMLVLIIPDDFSDRLTSGRQAQIQVITDGRNITTAAIAQSYVASIVSRYNSELIGGVLPMHMEPIVWYNPNLITRWMFLPAMLPLLSLIQVIMLSGLSVAREKEQGTFEQLLVIPLSPMEILIGKAIPPLLIGLFQVSLVLIIAVFWFEVYVVGSLLVLYLTLVIFLLSCIGMGLSISAISNNMQQVMVFAFLLLLPMALLSGMATPIRNMPELLQYITYANPLRFAMEAVRRIYLEGAGIGVIVANYIPMLAVASITMPMAAWLFKHKLS